MERQKVPRAMGAAYHMRFSPGAIVRAMPLHAGIHLRAMERNLDDLDLLARCLSSNGVHRDRRQMQWQYLDNPARRTLADFAVAPGGRLAAVYATLPTLMRIDGRVELAAQSVDTMTDGAFRGRGLFVRLANATYDRAQAEGFRLVYGFPNQHSAHGFFDRLGWCRLGHAPLLIRPLRTRFLARKLGPLAKWARFVPDVPLHLGKARNRGIELVTRFDDRFTDLWHRFAAGAGIAIERDARYLDWRLSRRPGGAYENAVTARDGRLSAFVSHCIREKHGGRIGYVMESLHAPGEEGAVSTLLRRALARMAEERADVAFAWCMPHATTYPVFRRAGFLAVPPRFLPIQLHFGARALAPECADIVQHPRRWYISYLDSDTV